MRSETKQITKTTYYSEIRPYTYTDDPEVADVIAWADVNRVAWDIVTQDKSKVFGRGSCEYIGWAQKSMETYAVLQRLVHFHDVLFQPQNDIFKWRAQFTLDHYRDKGFTGGFFQQHDEKFPRACLSLDYTPELKEVVIDTFSAWCKNCYATVRITIDGQTVETQYDTIILHGLA